MIRARWRGGTIKKNTGDPQNFPGYHYINESLTCLCVCVCVRLRARVIETFSTVGKVDPAARAQVTVTMQQQLRSHLLRRTFPPPVTKLTDTRYIRGPDLDRMRASIFNPITWGSRARLQRVPSFTPRRTCEPPPAVRRPSAVRLIALLMDFHAPVSLALRSERLSLWWESGCSDSTAARASYAGLDVIIVEN